jgi:hypothetical protein
VAILVDAKQIESVFINEAVGDAVDGLAGALSHVHFIRMLRILIEVPLLVHFQWDILHGATVTVVYVRSHRILVYCCIAWFVYV